MKILIVSQYFYPENFKINDIALGLKQRGHHVAVLTGIPNYPTGIFFDGYNINSGDEVWNDIRIYRSKLIPRGKGGIRLLLNYLSFAFSASRKLNHIKEDFDKILVYEPSPVTVGIPAMKASKKFNAPYFFWVQDLWPESLTAAGGVKNPLILNLFDKLTRRIYNKAEKVLVQSEGFKEYILKQEIPVEKLIFYPNSTEAYYHKKVPAERYEKLLPKGFKIMFAGNLGEAQSLNTLLEAAEIVKNKNIAVKWIFLGNGRYRETLEKLIAEKKLAQEIVLLGAFPGTEMPGFFASADALVASLKKDKIFALTIPSKIQSYMACGKPILASLDGEGAKIVQNADCGFASPAENAALLAENVIQLYKLSELERQRLGDNAMKYFNDNFEREMLLDKLIKILGR